MSCLGEYLPRFTGNHLYPILPDYSEILHCYFVDIRITVYDIYNIYIYVYTTSSTTSSNHWSQHLSPHPCAIPFRLPVHPPSSTRPRRRKQRPRCPKCLAVCSSKRQHMPKSASARAYLAPTGWGWVRGRWMQRHPFSWGVWVEMLKILDENPHNSGWCDRISISNILELWSNWCRCITLIEILRSVLLHHPQRKSWTKLRLALLQGEETSTSSLALVTGPRQTTGDLRKFVWKWWPSDPWWSLIPAISPYQPIFRHAILDININDFETTCMTRKYSRGAGIMPQKHFSKWTPAIMPRNGLIVLSMVGTKWNGLQRHGWWGLL